MPNTFSGCVFRPRLLILPTLTHLRPYLPKNHSQPCGERRFPPFSPQKNALGNGRGLCCSLPSPDLAVFSPNGRTRGQIRAKNEENPRGPARPLNEAPSNEDGDAAPERKTLISPRFYTFPSPPQRPSGSVINDPVNYWRIRFVFQSFA